MNSQLLSSLYDIINSPIPIKEKISLVEEIRGKMEGDITDDERLRITHLIQSRVQDEAISAFKLNKYWGSIYMATGTGKSRIAIKMSEQIVRHEIKPRILLVVPTENLRDEGWKEEYTKWGLSDIWEDNVEAICYASLPNYTDQNFDLVILDEGHHLTNNNAEFFYKNMVKACVLLTATEPTSVEKQQILKKLQLYPVYTLNMDEAVRLGLIVPYDITIVTMELNRTDKNVKAGSKKKPFMQTEWSAYQYMCRQIIRRPSQLAFLKRMRFIYNLKSKTDIAKLMLEHVIPKDLRTIIFCGSIDQADEVCEYRYHSRTDGIDFAKFKAGIINRLSCVNAINEGQNIAQLDVGFILQLNSNQLHLVQRMGRFLRYRPGGKGKLIILVCIDTVELSWVERVIQAFDSSRVEIIKLSELRTGQKQIKFS